MRVALISDEANPLAVLGTGIARGRSVYLAGLGSALAARDHEVLIYTRRDAWRAPPRCEPWPGVTVVHVTAGPARPATADERSRSVPAFARRLIGEWSNGHRPDIVHAHGWRAGAAAVIAAKAIDVPVVQSFHGLSEPDGEPPERPPTEADLLTSADHVIATRPDEAPELARRGVTDDRVTVAPGGVDTERFAPDGDVWERGERPRLVCLGQLTEDRGVDTVVETLPQLGDAELVVAGGPPVAGSRVDGEVQRLTRLAGELSVGGRVLLVGNVKHELIPRLLRSADVVVSVPRRHPARLAPLEAMSCARPVVCTAVDGQSAVDDGLTGVVVEPNDPGAVREAVSSLLSDGELAGSLGDAGRRAVAPYDWKQVASSVEEAYGAAVDGAAG
jgi:D-inositol-3-phosphate glycosyltransferase